MRSYFITYLATAIVFFGMDFIWLSASMSKLYKPNLPGLLLDKPNLPVACGFYLLYVAGIVVFCVLPALQQASWKQVVVSGAFFGLVAYGTYDMTNLATLKNWSVLVSVIDMAWGAFATGVAATAAYFLTRLF